MDQTAPSIDDRIHEASALHRAGDLVEAARRYRAILDEDPSRATVWSMLGHVCMQRSADARAAECFKEAAQRAPDQFLFHFFHGVCLRRLGQLEGAAASLAEACRLKPDHLEAHDMRIGVLRALGDERALEQAEADLRAALPTSADEADRASTEREQARQMRDALILAERAAELDPAPAERWARLGALRQRMGDSEGALEAYQSAIERDPVATGVAPAIVRLCERLGRLEDARWYAGSALERDPHAPELNLALARLDRRDANLPAARARLEAQLASQRISSKWVYASVLTELGRTLDATGSFDQAFSRFTAAQDLLAQRSQARRFSPRELPAWIDLATRALTPELVQSWGEATDADEPAELPVFVVGFPSAGVRRLARLLEPSRDLAVIEHADLLAGLARKAQPYLDAETPFPANLSSLTPDQLEALRATYLRDAEQARGEHGLAGRRVVEAAPMNISRLALIRRLFPGAPVIAAIRDPRDTCLSCYIDMLAPSPTTIHFHALDSTARLLALVMGYDRHQREALGLGVLEVRYERLIDDPASCARQVGDFLGLGASLVDDGPAAPADHAPTPRHEAESIDELPVGRWRRYASYLESVRETLDPVARELGYDAS